MYVYLKSWVGQAHRTGIELAKAQRKLTTVQSKKLDLYSQVKRLDEQLDKSSVLWQDGTQSSEKGNVLRNTTGKVVEEAVVLSMNLWSYMLEIVTNKEKDVEDWSFVLLLILLHLLYHKYHD
ncbi:hypothetical protein Tco_0403220 [Tanacetum coccineum]